MKQLLIETFPLKVQLNDLRESMNRNNGRIIIKNMKIQQAENPNKNQRIYSRSILERETKQLIENCRKVGSRGIIGELDHPNCLRPTAEILTKDGWKFIKDVSIGEEVITLNTNSGQIEWNNVNDVINQSYNGKAISIRGKNIDTVVTPNHRFVLLDRNGNYVIKTAQEILDFKEHANSMHMSIPTTCAAWDGHHYDEYVIPEITNFKFNNTKHFRTTQSKPLVLNAKAFFAFLGFYLAEGNCSKQTTSKKSAYGVFVSQNKGERSEKFKQILKELSPELSWNIYERKSGKGLIFNCNDARLWNYVKQFGTAENKFIPDDIKNASSELLQILTDWFLMGDGANVTYKGYSRKSIFSISKQMMEDFNEVLLKIGVCGVIKVQRQKTKKYAGRIILEENCKPLYRLWIKTAKAIHIDFRFLEVNEIDYDDTVHCVSVDNGTFYCRDNRSPFWSGNSEIVNLKNACLGVLDYRWKGNDMLGDVEILNTPNGKILREIYEAGYVPGISSRGMGSVSESYDGDGVVEVEDDFSLLCWDAVSDPSSHNAYFKEIKEGKRLKESYNPIKNKNSKIDQLMQEILCEIGNNQCCWK